MNRYFVTIVGKTWGGGYGSLNLEFDKMPTLDDVKAKSGDFESHEIRESFVKSWYYEDVVISQ